MANSKKKPITEYERRTDIKKASENPITTPNLNDAANVVVNTTLKGKGTFDSPTLSNIVGMQEGKKNWEGMAIKTGKKTGW